MRLNTMIIILKNKELHPSLIEYFTKYQGYKITRATTNKHPKAHRINGDQFLHSFMPRTMRDLRAE